MNFIDIPNLPVAKTRLAVVDGRIAADMQTCLEKSGICLIKTERHPDLYEAIAFHPDIMLHHMGGNRIVYAPATSDSVLQSLEKHEFKLVEGAKKLSPVYPADIAYNGARVGNFFFHNLKYTDEILLNELASADIEIVNVRQGYAKCAVAVIDENCIITSDVGIANAAAKRGISVLVVSPQKNISLTGLDYGFIGGSSGMINISQLAVFGNAESLEEFSIIEKFLHHKKIEIVSLSDSIVMDYGSLLPLKT